MAGERVRLRDVSATWGLRLKQRAGQECGRGRLVGEVRESGLYVPRCFAPPTPHLTPPHPAPRLCTPPPSRVAWLCPQKTDTAFSRSHSSGRGLPVTRRGWLLIVLFIPAFLNAVFLSRCFPAGFFYLCVLLFLCHSSFCPLPPPTHPPSPEVTVY